VPKLRHTHSLDSGSRALSADVGKLRMAFSMGGSGGGGFGMQAQAGSNAQAQLGSELAEIQTQVCSTPGDKVEAMSY
jgi:hypothetical protein